LKLTSLFLHLKMSIVEKIKAKAIAALFHFKFEPNNHLFEATVASKRV